MKKAKGLWVLTLGAALMLAACDSEEIPSIPAGGSSDSSEIDVGSSSEEIDVGSSDESSESIEASSEESSSSESEEPPAPVAHAITIDPDLVGITITANPTEAIAGTTINLTYVVDADYILNEITVNGEAIEHADGAASFTMPDEAVAVSADVDPIPYHAVTVDADEHAHVVVSAESIKDGEDLTVTISFDEWYEADSITINGEDAVPNGEGVILVENVTAAVNIVVSSKLSSMSEGEGGVVEDWGSDASEEAAPNE